MESLATDTKKHHVLLTVLGSRSKRTCYSLDGEKAEADLAPLALFNLLPPERRPNCVLAICTPEAEKNTWPLLSNSLSEKCEKIDVSGCETQEGIGDYLEKITSSVPKDAELTVDITHGFRHFSFLTYMVVLYLSAFRGVRIRGAYYGMLKGEISPFLDLSQLLELSNWVYALRVFKDTGSALPMAKAFCREGMESEIKDVCRDLLQFSEAYLSGLPIELGQKAQDICEKRLKPLKKSLKKNHKLPLTDELVSNFKDTIESFALTEAVYKNGWKSKVKLSREELHRQGVLIENLLYRESYSVAIALMREWTVSWIIYRRRCNNGDEYKWLDKEARQSASYFLGTLGAVVSKYPELKGKLTEEQKELGRFWEGLTSLRNGYNHQGMRGEDMVGTKEIKKKIQKVKEYWCNLRCFPHFSLDIGNRRRVLVSPMGKSPGVLFSALKACEPYPDICLVICSEETRETIKDALENAGYEKGRVKELPLKDAFAGGRDEINRIVKEARNSLFGAEEVLVNLTGGTTLMGLAAEKLADEAKRLSCPVRRFGLIDRRPPSQQETNPFREGEPFWLDEQGGEYD